MDADKVCKKNQTFLVHWGGYVKSFLVFIFGLALLSVGIIMFRHGFEVATRQEEAGERIVSPLYWWSIYFVAPGAFIVLVRVSSFVEKMIRLLRGKKPRQLCHGR